MVLFLNPRKNLSAEKCVCMQKETATRCTAYRSFLFFFFFSEKRGKTDCEIRAWHVSVEVLRVTIYFRISALSISRFGFRALCKSKCTVTLTLIYKQPLHLRSHRTQIHSGCAGGGGLAFTTLMSVFSSSRPR